MMSTLVNLATHIWDNKRPSSDALTIILPKESDSLLDQFNIIYEVEREGLRIELADSKQPIFLYKTKEDCISFVNKGSFNKNIVILNGGSPVIYEVTGEKDVFFDCLLQTMRFFDFISSEVALYHDDVNKKFIIISEQKGKGEVGYRCKNEFPFQSRGLESLIPKVIRQCEEGESFISFFRDSLFTVVESTSIVSDRFKSILSNLDLIVENAQRDYQLYKSKFSFEKIRSELDKEKHKYLDESQRYLSDFIGKVSTLPIQFGAYIFLILRFSNELIPLFVVLFIIVVWGVFYMRSLSFLGDNLNHLSQQFTKDFEKIKKDFYSEDVQVVQAVIQKKIDILTGVFTSYRFVVLFMFCAFVVTALYLLLKVCL